MDIPFLYCVAGFIMLGVSGEALLRGAVTTADRLKVPPLLIGLTVIAFGTSIPELTVSLNAARSGNPDIAVGNVVGSNIANILLVLGAMAVFRSFTIDAGTLNRDGRVMLGVSVLMVLMALNGVITQWMGFGLLAILGGFTFLLYRRARQESDVDETAASVDENLLEGSVFLALLILTAGLAGCCGVGFDGEGRRRCRATGRYFASCYRPVHCRNRHLAAGAVYLAFCFFARACQPRHRQYYRQQYFQYPSDTGRRGQHRAA